jgi:hypothetical protein
MDSIPRCVVKDNKWVQELQPRMLNHTTTPLTRENPVCVNPPLTKGERRQRQIRGIKELAGRVAEAVWVRDDGKPHHFLTAETKVLRPDQVSITRWQLGLVASHQICRKCGASLSRQHGVECAEAEKEVQGLVGSLAPEKRWGGTALDWAINGLAGAMSPEQAKEIAGAIDKVERLCRGRERTEMGFWS